jgi:hypothetical protein
MNVEERAQRVDAVDGVLSRRPASLNHLWRDAVSTRRCFHHPLHETLKPINVNDEHLFRASHRYQSALSGLPRHDV